MRKILFTLITILLLILTVFIMVKGIKIGKLEIWGIKDIVAQDEAIDEENDKLSSLINSSYPTAISQLESDTTALEETKEEYEEQVELLSDSKYYTQTEEYKLEFLYTKIGNYAKENYITMEMKFVSGSTSELYNIEIEAVGLYSDVTEFIYQIENDSRLGFKIDDFSMTSSTDNKVRGTFSCKDIRIDINNIDTSNTESTTTNTNTNSTNTTSSSSETTSETSADNTASTATETSTDMTDTTT